MKRTEGVSSTDIVGRMLMLVRDNNRFSEVRCMLTLLHGMSLGITSLQFNIYTYSKQSRCTIESPAGVATLAASCCGRVATCHTLAAGSMQVLGLTTKQAHLLLRRKLQSRTSGL